MRNFCKTLFPVVEYAYGTIPTYPSGQIGFMLCSKNPVSVCVYAFVVRLSNSLRCWGWLISNGVFFPPSHTWSGFAFSLFETRRQISRNQWERCQSKNLKVWTSNITTLKSTKRRSSSPSLHGRYIFAKGSFATLSLLLTRFTLHVFFFFFLNRSSVKHDTKNPKGCCIQRRLHGEAVLSDTNSSLKIRPADGGDSSNCFQCLGTTDNERWNLSELDVKKKKVSVFFLLPVLQCLFIIFKAPVCLILTSGIVLSCLVLQDDSVLLRFKETPN